jgi:hypothetical protein
MNIPYILARQWTEKKATAKKFFSPFKEEHAGVPIHSSGVKIGAFRASQGVGEVPKNRPPYHDTI